MNPLYSFELLFFAVFGQTTTEQTRVHRNDSNIQPAWTNYLFKIVFGIYMLVSVVVLINLLIAMMSDTYQRIQVKREYFVSCKTRILKTRISNLLSCIGEQAMVRSCYYYIIMSSDISLINLNLYITVSLNLRCHKIYLKTQHGGKTFSSVCMVYHQNFVENLLQNFCFTIS